MNVSNTPDPASATVLVNMDAEGVENFPAIQTCTTESCIRSFFSLSAGTCEFEKIHPVFFNTSAYEFFQSLTLR